MATGLTLVRKNKRLNTSNMKASRQKASRVTRKQTREATGADTNVEQATNDRNQIKTTTMQKKTNRLVKTRIIKPSKATKPTGAKKQAVTTVNREEESKVRDNKQTKIGTNKKTKVRTTKQFDTSSEAGINIRTKTAAQTGELKTSRSSMRSGMTKQTKALTHKLSKITAHASADRQRRTSKRTQIDLYNFETSEECLKLDFSIEKENSPAIKPKVASKRGSLKSNDSSLSAEKSSKRPKLENPQRASPAFEFFSTKKKKKRLSESGVFMVPSPITFEHPANKQLKTSDHKIHTSTPANIGLKNTETKLQQESDKPASFTKLKTRSAKLKSSNETASQQSSDSGSVLKTKNVNCSTQRKKVDSQNLNKPRNKTSKNSEVTEKRLSARLNGQQSNEKFPKPLSMKLGTKSTSTPSMPLRNRSQKSKKPFEIESLFSPPKVSPVQKVDTPSEHGNVITSPTDCGGSPTFRVTRCAAALQDSMLHGQRGKTDGSKTRKIKENEAGTSRDSSQEYNSLMDESMFDIHSPVKFKPETKTTKHKSVRAGSKRLEDSSENEQHFNSERGTLENNSPKQDAYTDDEHLNCTKSGKYTLLKTNSIKKKGRYSTSKLDAWAREMNSEFDDIESYELSID